MRLKDKAAIITGAGGGIGRCAALLFAEHGARLVLADWKSDLGEETLRLVREAGGEAVFLPCDVSSEENVERLIRLAVDAFGKLDALYNNAAIGYSDPTTHGSVLDIAEENWDRVLDINLKSVYLCCKYAIPEMVKAGGGSIINTSSIMGLGTAAGADAYTAAKGAIIALSRCLAKQFGPHSVRVNVLCPGSIATPMIAHLLDEEGTRKRLATVPLGRIGRPEDVAHAALYFASDESSYTTGAVLVIDGGQCI